MQDPIGEYWQAAQARLGQALGAAVPSGARAVFLDYPVYGNVGDLMIFLGTERWLDAAGIRVLGRWHSGNFPSPVLPEETVILLQGGGNFGDLYHHQRFRERVVSRYPRNRIVFLPQTIHYRDPARLAASADVLDRHADIRLFVRGPASQTIARESFSGCPVRMVPDMATWLYPLLSEPPPPIPSQGTLYLLRRDRERRTGEVVPDRGPGWRGDWKDLLGDRYRRLRFWKAASRLYPAHAFALRWRAMVEETVAFCAVRFRDYEHVVSSRLHGALLGGLLGIPTTLLDNSYGKNRQYFEAWLRDLPGLDMAGEDQVRR
jgi:pyruvyl transferase EpsO